MTTRWIRYLGGIEFAGGIFTLLGWRLSGLALPEARSPLFLPPALAFAGLAIYAGMLLLRGDERGITPSIVVQIAQVFNFTGAWRYVALAGPKLTLVLASTGTGLSAGVGGQFLITPNPPDGTLAAIGLSIAVSPGYWSSSLRDASWSFGINFAALYCVYRLARHTRQTEPVAVDADAAQTGAPPAV